jgi:hypothetical protein
MHYGLLKDALGGREAGVRFIDYEAGGSEGFIRWGA